MIGRRRFVGILGRGSMAVAVLGVAACASDDDPAAGTTSSTGTDAPSTTATMSGASTIQPPPAQTSAPASTWGRVNLGFVSAYVVVRGGEGSVVDTGVEGSEDAIAGALSELGAGWQDVAHVILTHSHPDHVGSLAAVMTQAAEAAAHAHAADIPDMRSPRPIEAVADGDRIFGLQVVATPGHTPGHISLLDPALGVLFAGDALNGANGGVVGANPDFTPDMVTAAESVRLLAGLDFDAVVFGHGEPVLSGAADQVRALAEA